MVLSGKNCAAVCMITNCDPRGLLKPEDTCSKAGQPVIKVLCEKHPNLIIPPEDDFDVLPGRQEQLDSPPVYCYEKTVAKGAAKLSGDTARCGVEGIMLHKWLLLHDLQSECLWEEIAHWVCWLSRVV